MFFRSQPGLVLVYHRVTTLARDPQRLAIAPARFADHLAFLNQHAVPMPLADLVAGAASRSLPPKAVAVTFDDGYADNLLEALPLLEAHAVPATVFVTTGAVASRQEFWWDAVEQILLPDAPQFAAWTVTDPHAPSAGHARYRDVAASWRRLPPAEREAAIQQLAVCAGRSLELRASHRPLTPREVASLAANPLIEVGAHTMWHASLAALDPVTQRHEIAASRRSLERWIDRPVTQFAYPFGGRDDVDTITERACRDAGLTLACTVGGGPVTSSTPPHRVPRVIVRDWSVDEFARQWHRWAA